MHGLPPITAGSWVMRARMSEGVMQPSLSHAAQRQCGQAIHGPVYPGCAPGLLLSEAPYAELPEQGLTFVPLYYAGTLFGQTAGR